LQYSISDLRSADFFLSAEGNSTFLHEVSCRSQELVPGYVCAFRTAQDQGLKKENWKRISQVSLWQLCVLWTEVT
jgi:hypothetical protein